MCLEADTGKDIWSIDAIDDFGGSNIRWKITENLLIDGNKVFFESGGKKHNIVALNRFTGEFLWSYPFTKRQSIHANTPLFKDGHIYTFSTDEAGSVKLKLSSDGSQLNRYGKTRRSTPCKAEQ